jgi:dTDP-4-amino-4,6-dideoxygalactose transaminase
MNENANKFLVAEKAARECLSLPIFPELTDPQIKRVVAVIKDFFKK